MSSKQEKFIIIDGNALVHRAWHALPPTLTTKTGEIVNAVYGFTMILLKVLKDLKPDYLAVTFDLKGPTFRHKEYKEYKATRVKQADELYAQFPKIKEVVKAFNIPIYEKAGFEADDVIATLVKNQAVEKIQSIIVTGDLDTLQLVDANTEIYTMHKGLSDTVIYDIAEVKRRFDGLTPEQMVDFKALRGDPSDNIPGVRGIGEKGAISLLKEFKTLENLYQNLDSEKIKDRYRQLLKDHKKDARLSKKLTQLVANVPINFKLADSKVTGYDINKVMPLFQELEFKSLINKLPKELQTGKISAQGSFEFGETQASRRDSRNAPTGADMANYQLIKTKADFEKFINELKNLPRRQGGQKIFALDTETSSLDQFNSELLGISFCWQEGVAYYLPAKPDWLKAIKPILENQNFKKVGHNIKFDLESLATAGIKLEGISFDTMIASYLINPGSRQHNLDGLVFTELGHQMQPITELIGQGKNQISLKEVAMKKVADYSAEDADFTWRLVKILTEQLKEKNNLGLLEKIEVPLIPVLAAMEKNGVLIDTGFLKKMAAKVNRQLAELEKKFISSLAKNLTLPRPSSLKKFFLPN